MKRTSLACVVLFVATITPATAKDNAKMEAEGKALIEQAIRVSDLHGPGVGSYTLQAMEAIPRQHLEVRYQLYWDSQNYRVEATVGGRTEATVTNGAVVWKQKRTHIPIDTLMESRTVANTVDLLRTALQQKITGVRDQVVGGSNLKCVKTVAQRDVSNELCFDPATGVLLLAKTEAPFSMPFGGPLMPGWPRLIVKTVAFSDYTSFHGVYVPLHTQVAINGDVVSDWHVSTIRGLTAQDASLFSRPADSEEWPYCDQMTSPEPEAIILTGDESGVLRRIGMVALQLHISPEGKLSEGYVISEQKTGDGEKFLKMFLKRRFLPARCNGNPIDGDLIISRVGHAR